MEISVEKGNKLMNIKLNIGDNGRIIKDKVLVDLSFKMEIYIKEISKKESKQDLENNTSKMEINMKETMHQINSMRKVNINGKMVQYMKEIL